jgi:hypothetical protein
MPSLRCKLSEVTLLFFSNFDARRWSAMEAALDEQAVLVIGEHQYAGRTEFMKYYKDFSKHGGAMQTIVQIQSIAETSVDYCEVMANNLVMCVESVVPGRACPFIVASSKIQDKVRLIGTDGDDQRSLITRRTEIVSTISIKPW